MKKTNAKNFAILAALLLFLVPTPSFAKGAAAKKKPSQSKDAKKGKAKKTKTTKKSLATQVAILKEKLKSEKFKTKVAQKRFSIASKAVKGLEKSNTSLARENKALKAKVSRLEKAAASKMASAKRAAAPLSPAKTRKVTKPVVNLKTVKHDPKKKTLDLKVSFQYTSNVVVWWFATNDKGVRTGRNKVLKLTKSKKGATYGVSVDKLPKSFTLVVKAIRGEVDTRVERKFGVKAKPQPKRR